MSEQEPPEFDRVKELLNGIDPKAFQGLQSLTGGVITMMFTDIVGSTRVKKAAGDAPYFDALNRHYELMRRCVGDHSGRELKRIGDAFFIGFTDPRQAVDCAVEIQQSFGRSPIAVGGEAITVRIGLHTGIPKVYRDMVSGRVDLSGTEVDKGARVESIARGGQVLISEQTKTFVDRDVHDWGLWELKGLGLQRVYEVLWPGKRAEQPAGRVWQHPVHFLDGFVGRQKEVSELLAIVNGNRLVTLMGTGGVGKTRVADEVARRASGNFDEGASFIGLAYVQNSETAVVSELVARLQVDVAGFKDEAAALLATLRDRRMLLVLDHVETVMAGASSLLTRLWHECPAVHVLVTSPRALNINGEHLYELLPMATPAAGPSATPQSLALFDAFALFRERAREKRDDWDLAPENSLAMAEILKATEGIPLAIELAAARVRSLGLAETGNGLWDNRLDLLRRRGAGAEEQRDRSIEACIDWSFNLLRPNEKALFAKLSVFSGGFFVEDAKTICGEPSSGEMLETLRDASLLNSSGSLEKVRYRIPATVWEYACEKLGTDGPTIRRRHAGHFLVLLAEADRDISGKEPVTGFARIDADLENFIAAIDTCGELGEPRMLVEFAWFFAEYLSAKGRFADRLAIAQRAQAAAQEMNDNELAAICDINLGGAYSNVPTGDRSENLWRAITCYESALRVFTERDFPVQWATAQSNLGTAYSELPTGDRGENLKRAIACYQAALRVRTERDLPFNWATIQNDLGAAYSNLPTGDRGTNLEHAIACYQAALRVRTERDFPFDWATIQHNLGAAYFELPRGDRGENLKRAIACGKSVLRVYTERDFPADWAMTQSNLGTAYFELPTGDRGENLERAIACHEAAAKGSAAAGLTDRARRSKEQAERLRKLLATVKK